MESPLGHMVVHQRSKTVIVVSFEQRDHLVDEYVLQAPGWFLGQLQHAKGDAVHVEHDVRALGILAADGDLFGNGEVVGLRVLPVDEPDGLELLAGAFLHLHTVAQQLVDGLVGVVQMLAFAQRRRFAKLVQGAADQALGMLNRPGYSGDCLV